MYSRIRKKMETRKEGKDCDCDYDYDRKVAKREKEDARE